MNARYLEIKATVHEDGNNYYYPYKINLILTDQDNLEEEIEKVLGDKYHLIDYTYRPIPVIKVTDSYVRWRMIKILTDGL